MRVEAHKQCRARRRVSPSSGGPSAQPLAANHPAHSIQRLQRAIGNRAVQRLLGASAGAPVRLQAKLTVNTPGDIYEREADRVSEEVMSMSEPRLSRACACGGACHECRAEQHAHGHDSLHTKRVGAGDWGQTEALPLVNEVLRSPGQPLDPATRAFMEPRFGRDFSQVQIHVDADAAKSAGAIDAQAYTVGSHVVFGADRYAPATTEGRHLIAHELAHVLQQSAAPARLHQRHDEDARHTSSTGGPVVQRDPIPPRRRRHRGSHPATATPMLGPCRPVQDDVRPTAPWADLQRGYSARCASAAADVAGQAGRSLEDILHGRMPRAPHLPDARSSIDCACAHGTPEQAAWAAMPRLAAAGPLAASVYLHFLRGSGTPLTIDVATMVAQSAALREKLRRSIGRSGMTGTTRISQGDFARHGESEYQFAYGAIDCVQWVAQSRRRSWRSDPTTPIQVSLLDYYEFHPARPGVSQCAHAACVESVARGSAKNFWTSGGAIVSWDQIRVP